MSVAKTTTSGEIEMEVLAISSATINDTASAPSTRKRPRRAVEYHYVYPTSESNHFEDRGWINGGTPSNRSHCTVKRDFRGYFQRCLARFLLFLQEELNSREVPSYNK